MTKKCIKFEYIQNNNTKEGESQGRKKCFSFFFRGRKNKIKNRQDKKGGGGVAGLTLMLARMLRESSGPMVCDCGRSTRRRSPMVDSSTVRLVRVLGVRLITSICQVYDTIGGR